MKNWQSTLIAPEAPIMEAIRILDEDAAHICLVTDPDRKLLGTITDGDIRRGILRTLALSDPVSKVMNSDPCVAGPEETGPGILATMTRLQFRQMPVLDAAGRVIALQTINELYSQSIRRPNRVVLMAGGLGTRLRPLTDSLPKPLIPVGQKPVLETIVESFAEQNFEKFYLSVNYKAEMVEDYFGDGSRWGVDISYLHEEKPLGTAGPLGLIEDHLDDPLIVMNGDLLTRVNFGHLLDFHREQDKPATMGVREYDVQVPFGVVQMDQSNIIGIDEKPIHKFFVNAGIYVIDPQVLALISRGQAMDMPDLFQTIIEQGHKPAAFPIREYWLDIGRLDDLNRANSEFGEASKS
jgi:dTDP-glucose pyrophosphorylase